MIATDQKTKQLKVRLPLPLHAQIVKWAEENGRTLNGEIVERLWQSENHIILSGKAAEQFATILAAPPKNDPPWYWTWSARDYDSD